MKTFNTQAVVSGIDAQTVLEALLADLREHELEVTAHGDVWHVEYDGAQIVFAAQGDALLADIAAATLEVLFDARMLVLHHIVDFSGCKPEAIQWKGDQPVFERPPAFRLLTVESTERIGPHLRRVRFRTQDLARYERDDDIHCKLILPQPGVADPEWPTLGADGAPRFPTGEKRLDIRTYTIRRIDAEAGWMDIDFVLHDDAGPGARWAAQAQPGQQIGVSGPGGRTARPSAWMLMAGDETALPAMARVGENLPAETRGEVFIEVQDAADEIPMTLPKGMSLRWLHRGAAAPGTTTLLRDAIFTCAIPPEGDLHVWVGAEFSTAQTVRAWLRDTVGIRGKDQLVVAYWRHGMDETRMKSGGEPKTPSDPADKVDA